MPPTAVALLACVVQSRVCTIILYPCMAIFRYLHLRAACRYLADMSRVLIGGMDYGQGVRGQAADEADMSAVLDAGCGLVFGFSNSTEVLVPDQSEGPCRTDEQGAAMLARLCRGPEGGAIRADYQSEYSTHARQIVFAQSFVFRTQLSAYGGDGYSLPATLPRRLQCATHSLQFGNHLGLIRTLCACTQPTWSR